MTKPWLVESKSSLWTTAKKLSDNIRKDSHERLVIMSMVNRSEFSAGLAAKLVGVFADEGAEPKDLNLLAENPKLVKKIIDVIRDKSEVTDINYSIDFDSHPPFPDGLTFSGPLPNGVKGVVNFGSHIKTTFYLDSLQKGVKKVEGHRLLIELKKIKVCEVQLLYFYLSHPQLIPKGLELYKIFFWGTICRDYTGKFYVPYMRYCYDREWQIDYRCLDLEFDCHHLAVVFED